jgi:20S proteasome alpha/beta subunit
MLTNDFLSIEFEHPQPKITRLTETCVALTAGNALAHTELLREAQSRTQNLRRTTTAEVADIVKECYQSQRQAAIEDHVLRRRGISGFAEYYKIQQHLDHGLVASVDYEISTYDYGLSILVAGADVGAQAHIYAVENPGICHCLDAIGYHATGSGLPHAVDALITQGCNPSLPMEHVLCIVYAAKKRAEKAPGVGKTATDVALIADGQTAWLTHDQVERLQEFCPSPKAMAIDSGKIRAILDSEKDKGAADAIAG